MHTLRRLIATIGIASALCLLGTALFGAQPFARAFITLTAIDHWHPYWPNDTTIETAIDGLPYAAAITTALAFALYLALGIALHRSPAVALPAGALGGTTHLAASALPRTPSREEFHADLAQMLRDAGVTPERALDAADAAMLAADSDDITEWAGRVRAGALTAAGITGPNFLVLSREPHLDRTAQFLRDYGYQALAMKRVGTLTRPSESGSLNFDGLLVFHRTTATAAEEALIELLITTHQAHLASIEDNGERDKAEAVKRYAETLKHVCTKLALRGFVPPELDAEIGRDGTATAEELERWAIAQVVASCSPMTRMPLPTIERPLGGQR